MRGATAAIVGVCLAMMFAALPPFMIGAHAVRLRPELGFGEAQLGAAISSYYVMSTAASLLVGRVTRRLGWRGTVDVGMLAAVGGMAAIGALAHEYWHLLAILTVSGMGVGLVVPTTNLAITRNVPPHRRGLALGLKQAAMPSGVVVAGAAAVASEHVVDWRWLFVATLAALAYRPLLPRADRYAPEPRPEGAEGRRSAWALPLLAVGAGLGLVASSVLTAYYVESAVALGSPATVAGILYAAGGVSGALGRILWGQVADRRPHASLPTVAILLAVGGVGAAALGGGLATALLAVATIAAFGFGWAWSGLLFHGIVRIRPEQPAQATGVAQGAMFVGAIVGPTAFGLGVEAFGHGPTWLAIGAVMLAAAGFVAVATAAERRAAARAPA